MKNNSNGKRFGGTIRFKQLMKKLNKRLADLSDLVKDMIQSGQTALIEDREEIYKELGVELAAVHHHCHELEDVIQSSLALHQPFAGDLRYILSTLKISNDIHRSAHDAVHVAHSSIFIESDQFTGVIKRFEELLTKAASMFEQSIDAFRNRKVLDLDEWKHLDDEVDDLHKEIIDEITQEIAENPDWTRAGISLILSSRYIERIADHACNIVEEGYYVVTGRREKIE
jgi:phosphate transport system protein